MSDWRSRRRRRGRFWRSQQATICRRQMACRTKCALSVRSTVTLSITSLLEGVPKVVECGSKLSKLVKHLMLTLIML